MQRVLVLTLLACTAVAVLMLSGCEDKQAGSRPVAVEDVRRHLPEGATLVVFYNGQHPEMAGTALADIWNEPGMKEFFEPVWAALRATIRQNMPPESGAPDILSLEPLLGTQMAVAAYLPQPGAAGETVMAMPQVLAAVDVGAEGSHIRKAVDGALAKLAGPPGGAVDKQNVNGIEVTPLMGGMAVYAYKGQTLLVGMNDIVVKALDDKAAKLTASKLYGEMVAQTDLGREVIGAYVDLAQLLKMVPPEAAPVHGVLGAVGVDRIKGAALTWAPKGKGMMTTLYINTPTDKGLISALVAEPVGDDLLRMCPKDAGMMVACNLDAAKLYDAVLTAIGEVAGPEAMQGCTEVVKAVEEKLGVKIREQLLASLGQGTMLTVQKGGLLLPNITLVQRVKDAEQLDAVLGRLLALASQKINQSMRESMDRFSTPGDGRQGRLDQVEYRGTTIKYANCFIVTPAYAIKDGFLIVACSPVEVKDFLDTLARGSIAANADWTSVRRQLTLSAPQGLYYGEFKGAVRKCYYLLPTIAAVVTTLPQVPVELDVGKLPGAERIASHLFAAAGAWKLSENGLKCELYSPTGTGAPPTSLGGLLLFGAISSKMGSNRAIHLGPMPIEAAPRQKMPPARAERPGQARSFVYKANPQDEGAEAVVEDVTTSVTVDDRPSQLTFEVKE